MRCIETEYNIIVDVHYGYDNNAVIVLDGRVATFGVDAILTRRLYDFDASGDGLRAGPVKGRRNGRAIDKKKKKKRFVNVTTFTRAHK